MTAKISVITRNENRNTHECSTASGIGKGWKNLPRAAIHVLKAADASITTPPPSTNTSRENRLFAKWRRLASRPRAGGEATCQIVLSASWRSAAAEDALKAIVARLSIVASNPTAGFCAD